MSHPLLSKTGGEYWFKPCRESITMVGTTADSLVDLNQTINVLTGVCNTALQKALQDIELYVSNFEY